MNLHPEPWTRRQCPCRLPRVGRQPIKTGPAGRLSFSDAEPLPLLRTSRTPGGRNRQCHSHHLNAINAMFVRGVPPLSLCRPNRHMRPKATWI
jgi:hypothetical protein